MPPTTWLSFVSASRPRRAQIVPWAVVSLVVLSATTIVLASETGSTEDSEFDGSGESYWGPIAAELPAKDNPAAASLESERRALWVYPIVAANGVVEGPIRVTEAGLHLSYLGLKKSGVVPLVQRVFAPRIVPYGFLFTANAGGLAGGGLGVTLYHDKFLGEHNRLRLRSNLTTEGTKKATLGGVFAEGESTEFEIGVGYRLRQNARYFGLGSESPEYLKSFYTQETSWGGIQVRRVLGKSTSFALGAVYSGIATRSPAAKNKPDLEDEFGDNVPKGFGDISTGATFSASLIRDTTTKTGRPDSGTITRIRTTHFAGTGDEARVDFWSYRGDLETFVPLWFTDRTLALRTYLQWIDSDRLDVPFQRLLTNDEPDQLRGFKDYRWRDRGITALSLEYRWPVWAYGAVGGVGLDAYGFSDVGQVFHEFDRIAARNLTYSYGGGFRLIGRRGFGGRIELAHSEEETVFRISSDQIFQYAKGGLLHGRDQAALR